MKHLHFLDYSKFRANPFTICQSGSCKIYTYTKDLLTHAKILEVHTTHSARQALHAAFFIHFKNHA